MPPHWRQGKCHSITYRHMLNKLTNKNSLWDIYGTHQQTYENLVCVPCLINRRFVMGGSLCQIRPTHGSRARGANGIFSGVPNAGPTNGHFVLCATSDPRMPAMPALGARAWRGHWRIICPVSRIRPTHGYQSKRHYTLHSLNDLSAANLVSSIIHF